MNDLKSDNPHEGDLLEELANREKVGRPTEDVLKDSIEYWSIYFKAEGGKREQNWIAAAEACVAALSPTAAKRGLDEASLNHCYSILLTDGEINDAARSMVLGKTAAHFLNLLAEESGPNPDTIITHTRDRIEEETHRKESNTLFVYGHTTGGKETMGAEKCPAIRPETEPPSPKFPHISRFLRLFEACPTLSFAQAFAKLGSENLPTIYELAMMKKRFMDEGVGRRYGTSGGPFGTLGGLEQPYFWSGEFLGSAPKGHPAEGQIIIAKIDDVSPEEEWRTTKGAQFSGKGMIRPSKTKFTVCGEQFRESYCAGSYITGFKPSAEGLMVPVLGQKIEGEQRITDFGGLLWTGAPLPMCMRPASWHTDLSFTPDPMECTYRVLRRDWLQEMGIL